MSKIFALSFCFLFAPTGRANARRRASGGPLVGLLSLSFCLLTLTGGQALAEEPVQSPGYGAFSYPARNQAPPASAPAGLAGPASSETPWYADQARRRQAAAARPQVEGPAPGLPSYAPPQGRSRQAAAARKPPVKSAANGEAQAVPPRPSSAAARADDSGWTVPAAWRAVETARQDSASAAPGRSSRVASGGFVQRGVASWYGGRFHGRKTASGERYDQNQLTAAHKTLPFGVLVEVTNQNNGRNVVVRINDRGPFYKGRVIDLSRGAAQMLDIDGIAPVTIKVVSRQVKGPATLH